MGVVIRWCCGHTSICVSRVYAFSFGDVGSRIFQLMVSQECASPPSCPAFGSCPPPGALPCPCPVSVAMDLNFSDSDDSAEDVVEAMPQTSGEQEPWAEGAIRELKQQPCSQGVHEDGDAWKLQRTHAASEADRLTKTQSSAYGRMEQQCGSMPYPPKPPMLPPFGMGQSQQMGPAADADSWAAWPTPQQLADQRSALIHHMPPPHPNAAMPLTRLSMVAAAPACGSMLSAISEPVVGHQGVAPTEQLPPTQDARTRVQRWPAATAVQAASLAGTSTGGAGGARVPQLGVAGFAQARAAPMSGVAGGMAERQKRQSRKNWTPAEDQSLLQHVKDNGTQSWSEIAVKLPGRISKQCRER